MATPRIADSVGRVLGDRYRLTRPLGVGASARVYVAEDVSLRRRVAIKVLHPALAGDAGFLRRFRAEAQVVAALRHPNILTVFDWGEDGGSPYLVMELLEGGSLRALLDRGVLLSPAQAAAVGSDAARALDYAHRRGLVHRDIKPANLIFDDEGRVRVADFGLARALAEATWTEPAGAVVGTARYAAPEQVRGEKLDNRADVYSLALVLVEATTGTVPFASDTTLGTLMARIERKLVVPEAAGPLAEVLEAAGEIDPAGRLDAAGFANGLDRVGAKLPGPAPLPLASPIMTGRVEEDLNPTEFPGRPQLFDVEVIEGDGPGPTAGPGRRAGAGSPAASGDRRASEPGEPRPEPKLRSPLRRVAWLTALLVLLAGAAAAAVITTRALVPSHLVPNLVGKTTAQATTALKPLHLHLRIAGSRYDDSASSGVILSQSPNGGRLKEGQAVSVVVSNGPQPVPVPTNLTGMNEQTAISLLQVLHLKPFVAKRVSSLTFRAGTVISSVPSGGTLLPGQKVALTISTGKPTVVVPALDSSSSASFAAAQAVLASKNLVATATPTFSDSVPKGHVIGTSPPAGATVYIGTHVAVLVSKGPQLIAVPDVSGDTVSVAAQILNNDGFAVSGVSGNPNRRVSGTNPPQGTLLRKGAAVQIITG